MSVRFAQDVRRFAERAKAAQREVRREAASEVARLLAQRTHVASGRLVANWTAGVGPGPHSTGDEAPDPSRSRALAQNLAVIERAPDAAPLTIDNTTPYILHEEFGTSRRGPHPVFRGIAAELPTIAAEAAAKAARRR